MRRLRGRHDLFCKATLFGSGQVHARAITESQSIDRRYPFEK